MLTSQQLFVLNLLMHAQDVVDTSSHIAKGYIATSRPYNVDPYSLDIYIPDCQGCLLP